MDVECSDGAVKTAFDIQVNGKSGPGRPKMTWKQLTERDRKEWKLSAIDPHVRDTWRSGVRSAIQINGKRGPGRLKMTWKQLTERDRREWKLSAIDPHDRDTWRSDVRSAILAASQLPGRGPTVVDMAPTPAC